MVGSLFSALDSLMAALPGTARLIVWAALAAIISMAAYRLGSPQTALRRIRQRRAEVQHSLRNHDGAIADAYPLLGESLRLAFAQLLRVLAPTALAALPVLALLFWLDMTYGYAFPAPGQSVAVETTPAVARARLVPPAGSDSSAGITSDDAAEWAIVLRQSEGQERRIALPHPVPALYRWQWWNVIVGNPAGYLPSDLPVEIVELDLPPREYLPVGPDWLRPWYSIFLAVLFATSLGIKFAFRII